MPDAKLPSLAEDDGDEPEDATRVGAAAPLAAESALPLKGYLTVVVGADPGRIYPLNAPTITIGRGNECEVRLESESISRKHARMTRHQGNYTIEDLGSTNGTWVDGASASPEPLKSGARIRVGNEVIVRFSMLDDAEAALQQRLYEGVVQDTLTGAHNRRYFERCLATEVAQSGKFNLPLALFVVEVDDMKGINDYYTQAGGDALLRAVAKHIQDVARKEDIVARVGTDKFAILARGMSQDELGAFAKKIPVGIERLEVLLQSGDFSMRIEQVKSYVSVVELRELPPPHAPESFFAAGIKRLAAARAADDGQ